MLTRRTFAALVHGILLDRPLLLHPHSTAIPSSARRAATSQYLSGSFASAPRHSSSSTRWKARATKDRFNRDAKVQGLKSRAAFKLLEVCKTGTRIPPLQLPKTPYLTKPHHQINQKHRLFKPGQTVVDLGYAPGSWSQVAIDRTQPHGRVVGIDLLPTQPPRGVSTIQGNFLSPDVQAEVRRYVQDCERGRARNGQTTQGSGQQRQQQQQQQQQQQKQQQEERDDETRGVENGDMNIESEGGVNGASAVATATAGNGNGSGTQMGDVITTIEEEKAYIDRERESLKDATGIDEDRVHNMREEQQQQRRMSMRERDEQAGRVVDVVLSDMCEPWEQTSGFWQRSVSDVYDRLMNTSGIGFRDHAGSMVSLT